MKLLVPVLFLLLSGCATVTQGRTQRLVISSTPPGAVVSVDGVELGVTPAVAEVARNRPHTLRVTLEGHAPQAQSVTPTSRPELLYLNAFLLHPAVIFTGFAVDLATRSHLHFDRAQITFVLERGDSSTLVRRSQVDANRASLPIGARVRVVRYNLPTSAATIGSIQEFLTDTLVIASGAPSVLNRIPNRSIESLDLSLGPDRVRSAMRWAGGGAITGLILGIVVGGAVDGVGGAIIAGGVYSMYGAAGGMVLGAIAGKTDRWTNVFCCSQQRP